jgi:hypothetical protein
MIVPTNPHGGSKKVKLPSKAAFPNHLIVVLNLSEVCPGILAMGIVAGTARSRVRLSAECVKPTVPFVQ